MKAKLIGVKAIFIGLGLCVLSGHAAGLLFNTTFVKNTTGNGGYLTVRTTTTQTYQNAGILLANQNYVIASTNKTCTKNPANGWCLFSVSNQKAKTIQLTQVNTKTTVPDTVSVQLSLNALSNPVSSQIITAPAQTPGRIIGYLYGWETPPAASAIAAAHYTHVLIAFGLFGTTSPGTINIQSISGFDLKAYVASLHQNNIKVLLSIGGASTNIPNTTVDFNDAESRASSPLAFETNFIASLSSLVKTYNFDGFDFDIESGLNGANSFTNPSLGCSNASFNAQCDISYLSNIINAVHKQNPKLLLTLAPQIANIAATSGFNATWGNYASLIMQTYASLEWVGFQNYNAGCAYGINLVCYPIGTASLTSTPDAAVAFATDLLANWPPKTKSGQATGFQPYTSYLHPSQVVIGYTVENAAGQSDGYPPAITSVTQSVIQCLRSGQFCATYTPPALYPGIGGVFSWSINYDASNKYQFATSLYPCVVQGNCT